MSVTTDIMVGFPGETDEEHQESMTFIREVMIDNLHIFKYSKRKGTRAAVFPDQVDDQVKKTRAKDMAKLRDTLHRKFLENLVGMRMNVLVEKNKEGLIEGHSDNFIKVLIDGNNEKIAENCIVTVDIVKVDKDMLIGGIL